MGIMITHWNDLNFIFIADLFIVFSNTHQVLCLICLDHNWCTLPLGIKCPYSSSCHNMFCISFIIFKIRFIIDFNDFFQHRFLRWSHIDMFSICSMCRRRNLIRIRRIHWIFKKNSKEGEWSIIVVYTNTMSVAWKKGGEKIFDRKRTLIKIGFNCLAWAKIC
jgi:hypothetical protein